MKKYLWAVIYGVILTAFTVYATLDTFVITRVYETPVQPVTDTTAASNTKTDDSTSEETTEKAGTTEEQTTNKQTEAETTTAAPVTEPVITDNSYDDGNIKIEIKEYRYFDTTVYVADVILSSADYLKTALAKNSYGKNVTAKTSEIAKSAGAILAINGDYYGARESGYVIRNGVLYRNKSRSNTDILVIYDDGDMAVMSSGDITAEQLLADGASDVFSFGPGLLDNGQIIVSEGYEVGVAMASNPRTAIGMIDELHYVFIVSDGRTNESRGLSLYELACFMQDLGVTVGYNLDGGGSSTMVFNDEVINNPTTNGRKITERSVSDVVFIGY
ncbi:MAG: phosphodiester glycosidase family protein [Clostridia bacterium]|nr:phosphodiester glycosidase family protein [Clostridia bacterium]